MDSRRSDTPFRRFMRARVHHAAARGIEENARRQLHFGPTAYDRMVKERLDLTKPDGMVLAVCAEKHKDLKPIPRYYPLFRDFARDCNDHKSRIVVCRLFLRRGRKLENTMFKAWARHQKDDFRDAGVLGLQVDVNRLESEESIALARANDKEHFGFLVFISPAGNFAITHATDDGKFHSSEWRHGANLRQFVALFDYLLLRSDEFTKAVEEKNDDLSLLRHLRNVIGSIKGRDRMDLGWPSEDEILESTEPTGWPGIHVIGSFARQSTFFQTQVRALNLAWALLHRRTNEKKLRIAVIGNGIAGLTFTYGTLLASPDCRISMFGQSGSNFLPEQRKLKSDRYLHPSLYNWPKPEPEPPEIPLLQWQDAQVGRVTKNIIAEFKKLRRTSEARLTVIGGRAKVERAPEGRYDIESCIDKGRNRKPRRHKGFDLVVFCVGFGSEHDTTYKYWDGTVGFSPAKGANEVILVAGNGDGGLVDLASIAIEKFHQLHTLEKLHPNWSDSKKGDDVRKSLVEIEAILAELGPAAKNIDLRKMYKSWLSKIAPKLKIRQDVHVYYCAGSDKI